jgi:poly(3-hydroxybutyrate) depolymerase
MRHRGMPVDLGTIRRCALMAIEGEKDDITGIGQTRAALELTTNLAAGKKAYHLQMGAGHYGIFNGSRFRAEIAPQMVAFMAAHDGSAVSAPPIELALAIPQTTEPVLEIPPAFIARDALAAGGAVTELHASAQIS